MERKLSIRMYVFAFVISLLVFVVGLVVGWQLGFNSMNEMRTEMNNLASDSASMELIGLVGNQTFACPIYGSEFSKLFNTTEQYGAKLQELENKNGKLDPNVMELKKDYASMQLRNYLLQKKMDPICGTQHDVILYFYSNENYSVQTDEGLQISALSRDVYTYNFDVNVDSSVVNGLKAGYNVSKTPTLIVNGIKYEGFKTTNEIAALFETAN